VDYSESIALLERRIAQLEEFMIPAILPIRVTEEVITIPGDPPRYHIRWTDSRMGFEAAVTTIDPTTARIINRRLWNEALDQFLDEKFGPREEIAPPQE
jgi:Fe-S-cluster formation regulator IscX/YfhJ